MTTKIELAQVDAAPPPALKPPVDPASLAHRDLLGGEFWRAIPAYAAVSEAEFLDHKWQAKHSITNISKLLAARSNRPEISFASAAGGSIHPVHLLQFAFADLFGAMDPDIEYWAPQSPIWDAAWGRPGRPMEPT